jgi:hypothetical protein
MMTRVKRYVAGEFAANVQFTVRRSKKKFEGRKEYDNGKTFETNCEWVGDSGS